MPEFGIISRYKFSWVNHNIPAATLSISFIYHVESVAEKQEYILFSTQIKHTAENNLKQCNPKYSGRMFEKLGFITDLQSQPH